MSPITCISLWDPWAHLWVTGEKIHETRGWYTNHRGLLLVHSAKNKSELAQATDPRFRDALARHGITLKNHLALGAIIGVVWIDACLKTEAVRPLLPDKEVEFGNFDSGRFAWRAGMPVRFARPIPCVGRQGLFHLPAELRAAVEEQLGGAQ